MSGRGPHPLATVVVTSYNYGRFLAEAIDSALDQTYAATEVIVVDDGSTDDSRDVIEGYGGRITAILKENGGQGSSFNVGFAASQGSPVLFLDSDDILAPTAVDRAAAAFQDQRVVHVHSPLWEIDEAGKRSSVLIPDQTLSDGDLRDLAIETGPCACVSAPTTGNAWSRRFLEQILPMPEREYITSPDAYLRTLSPLFGRIVRLDEPLGSVRLHGANVYNCKPASERVQHDRALYDRRCELLSEYLARQGVIRDPSVWKQGNEDYEWLCRFGLAVKEVKSVVPEGATFVLVDDQWWGDNWGNSEIVAGRRQLPFLERNGEYWGNPSDSSTAIAELERLRASGASHVVFAWPAFWWLDHYAGFAGWLRDNFSCVLDNERVLAFDLAAPS